MQDHGVYLIRPLTYCLGYIRNCKVLVILFIVSTRGIRWILWFSVRYAAATHREIFGVTALRGKLHQLGSPNLQDFLIGGGGGGGGGKR